MLGSYGKKIASTTFETNETIRLAHIEGKPLGSKRIHQITKHDCQAWVDGLRVAPRTARRYAGFLARLFSLAEEAEIITASPAKKLKLPVVTMRENRTLSVREVLELIKPDTPIGAMALLAIHTGMNRSEITRLKWEHVKSDRVMVPGTKNAYRHASVPITQVCYDLIMSQPRRSEFVFTTEMGTQYRPTSISHAFSKHKTRWGIPPETRFQDLRGSFVSILIEQGADPRTVMELARHSSIQTTMQEYARAQQSTKIEAIERLSQSINLKK